jgi:hypothetical protein
MLIELLEKRRERRIQKRTKEVLDNLADGFTAVSLDESFFFYDSFVGRLCIYKDLRPVIRITSYFTQTFLYVCLELLVGLDNRQPDIPRIQQTDSTRSHSMMNFPPEFMVLEEC